ncbi:MAG TPA: anti-sigma factor [Dehalococcoidia bacterium]|nr:anti-sigma factor [Dehalococcoidia bacterium]
MNCDEVRELLPAYVLGALDADDLDAVEAHLHAGREHDDELVELRATVIALDRFADEPDLDVSFDAMRRRAEQPGSIRRIARSVVWQIAVAAVVLVAVFVAGWLAADLTGGQAQEVSILIQGPEGNYLVLESADSGAVTVTMDGFERLADTQAYQVWAIRDGQWLRVGVCNTNEEGWWHGDFAFTVRPGEQIALTIEPEGGSETPTSEPLLTSRS